MRAVVTGGAGFLGSHLCDRLLGKGYDVICLDSGCVWGGSLTALRLEDGATYSEPAAAEDRVAR